MLISSCDKKEDSKDPIEITAVTTNVSNYGGSDGSILVTITGGKDPFEYLWSNGAAIRDLIDIPAGSYTITVTDADGDTATHSETITQPDAPTEPEELPLNIALTGTYVSSYDGTNGAIDLNIEGGKAPYTIEWSNGISTEDLSDIKAGFYQTTVTVANSNTKKSNITIYEAFDLQIPEATLLADVTRLKQSGLRIEYNSLVIYIDPITVLAGYESDADIILITHDHSDHLNAGIIGQLATSSTVLLCPSNCVATTGTAAPGSSILEIAPDSIKTVSGISIEVVPAYNSNHSLPNSV